MSKRLLILTSVLVTAAVLSVTVFRFESKGKEEEKIDPAFSEYISAFTSGIISNQSRIRIILTNESPKTVQSGQPVEGTLFEFSPSVKGTAYWVDSRTIEFKPDSKLPSGQEYKAAFHLSQLMEVPHNLEDFEFSFRVIEQSMEVKVNGMTTTDKQKLVWQRITGTITTADYAESDLIQKIISAQQSGKNLRIAWTHNDDKTSQFTIDSVKRMEKKSEVTIKWNGKPIEVAGKDSVMKFTIPALGDFEIMNVEVVQSPDQYISVRFSDPLMEKQELNGLMSLVSQTTAQGTDENNENVTFNYVVDDNELRAYPNPHQVGRKTLNIESGIKNILGYPYKQRKTQEIEFEELKPEVKLVGKGVILPNSEGLIFPFQAVSLKAVDVKIIKIFENNVAQFLQVNNLDGNREMKRVGRVVLRKRIDLKGKSELEYQHWNNYSLDLSDLIKTEPGAIYKVVLSFKKEYSVYHCEGEKSSELSEIPDQTNEDESDDIPSTYYYDDDYYYNYDYEYSERQNPCEESYYYHKVVSRNILASDLGIIAKAGNNNSMTFAVTDMRTTKPVSNVTLQLYNYQHQLIGSVKTNDDGQASVEMKKKPFLLVAMNGAQRGYLKLDDGSSLSLSMFDVSGENVQKGVKGFIYGERGVWRPGDSLYLMFMLEDKLRSLPPTHPVTFELSNPQGTVVKKMTQTSGLNGFYNFSTSTDPSAPTGNWTATVRVGGAIFSKTIKVETIMPNRLKLKLDFGVDRLTANKEVNGQLEAKWLHGAIAKDLAAKVEVSLNEVSTDFKKFPDYIFDDPARRFSTETQTIFDGKLDDKGVATVKPGINVKNSAPGMLKASFTTRVFEEGGAFSVDHFSLPYSPYESYVGIKMPKGQGWGDMLYTDTNNIVNIATVDANGNPVSRKKLTVQVYKVQWRWWWDSYDDELANYVGGDYHMPVQTSTVTTTNGKGTFVLRINRPDWGRFFVRVTDEESGHSTGQTVYIDWPYWYGKSDKGDDKGASMLSFNADKPSYNVGDNINLVIPSSAQGRALVSIENGSRVIEQHWVETKKGDTKYSFTASAEMTPNIYVNVTMVQPHAQTVNDLPIRMYGVIPLKIDDPKSHLTPELRTLDVWKPETKETITVNEKNGKPMTYSIAVVDEGLLDLTHFETPDPWNTFYAREALGVKTWDMYDMVIGAFSGKMQRVIPIGGDGEVEQKGGNKANRFKPMVRFIGPFYIGANQTKTHTIDIPQYVGSVRVMVVTGQDLAYGKAEKTIPVRTPLMILGTLPRVVGPNEEVELPVNVFAMEKNVKNVNVQVIPNNYFVLEDSPNKSVSFKEIGDEVVNFKLKVKPMLGVGKVKIIATSGKEKATYDIELDVRNPNPKVVNVMEKVLNPGETWTTAYTPVGMIGTNKGTIEVSNIPPIDLGRRLDYLVQYPHGCIEQTTSSVFPQLFVGDVMELNENYKSKIEQNIKAGINRLHLFMTTEGGFSYWPGEYDPSEWGSNYAGHFLLEAQAKGYTVPRNMLDNWKRYQKKAANNWTPKTKTSYYYYFNDDLEQAYRLYTLALAKAPELGAMNRLREYPGLSNVAKWRLAAAYQVAGYPDEAKKLAYNNPVTVKDYRELSYSYGSDERDEAMIIEALTLIGDRARAASLVKELSKEMSDPYNWMSTQTTAYALIAVSKFSTVGGSREMSFTCSVNGTQLLNKTTKSPISQTDMGIKNTSGGNVQVVNKGAGILYARVVLEGVPEEGDQSSSNNDLNLSIDYKTMEGKDLDPEKLEQGTDFYAEVTVTNPGTRGSYREMALTQIFPSGWEIHNTRMDESESSVKSSTPTYQDIRDDRVYTYFNLSPNETKTFRIILNATYMGKYYLPTVYCEAMYDNTINARKPGKWIEVNKPGGDVE
ncbi:MAG TPA: MG2 domain-containing protein [Bacteroidia bacterium]